MSETTKVDVLATLRKHRADCDQQGCEWCRELDGVIGAVSELISWGLALRLDRVGVTQADTVRVAPILELSYVREFNAALARAGGAK